MAKTKKGIMKKAVGKIVDTKAEEAKDEAKESKKEESGESAKVEKDEEDSEEESAPAKKYKNLSKK